MPEPFRCPSCGTVIPAHALAAHLGRHGGAVKSDRKKEAAIANSKRPRPRTRPRPPTAEEPS